MKKLSLLSLLFSSCTLLFFGLNAGDRCDEANFPSLCEESEEYPKGLFQTCSGGTKLIIPCEKGCTADGDTCLGECGDGFTSGDEECDINDPNAPPCDTGCQRIPSCGDRLVDFPEQCDTNPVGGNQCDDNCRLIPIPEVEPNDDFVLFNKQALITDDIVIAGAQTSIGDRDFYTLQNTNAEEISIRVDMYDPAFGLRAPCPFSLESNLGGQNTTISGVFAQSETSSFALQERQDECFGGDITLESGQTITLMVIVDKPYLLEIDFNGGIVCGDGDVDLGEGCDPPGNATCDLFCQRIPVCGDKFIDAGEECDDGNNIADDGCDACVSIHEAEPNDDGSPELGTTTSETGNDFSAVNANGPFTGNVILSGSISPAGDEDIYAFQNNSTIPQELRIEVSNADLGVGVSCSDNEDTFLSIRNEAGALLASNDNRDEGGRCSSIRFTIASNQTIFAQLLEFNDDGVINGYVIVATYTPAVEPSCGDNIINSGEQCDDGNTTNNDGCDATCQFEGVIVPEIEPNFPSPQGRDAAGTPFESDSIVIGNAGQADFDYFLIHNNSNVARLFSYSFFQAGGSTCSSLLLPWQFRTLGGEFFSLGTQRQNGSCLSAELLLAPDQTLSLEGAFGDYQGQYFIIFNFDGDECGNGRIEGDEECEGGVGCDNQCQRIPVCGDAQVDAPESCDDGNTQAGDGCGSDCRLELSVLAPGLAASLEQEPNDDGHPNASRNTSDSFPDEADIKGNDFSAADADGPFSVTPAAKIFFGALNPLGDEDIYAIQNPTNSVMGVRVDTFHPVLGVDHSCGLVLDSQLTIRDAAGNLLAKNDDRDVSDRCAGLHIDLAPQQTVFLSVMGSHDFLTILGYLLVVKEESSLCGNGTVDPGEQCDGTPDCESDCTLAPAVCGDGTVGIGESCDDQNLIDNDGCSALCQLEDAGFDCLSGQSLIKISATDLPKNIPDSDPAGITSTINVTDIAVVQRVIVGIDNVTHTFDGDLKFSLISPAGTQSLVFDKRGATAENILGAILDNNCPTPLSDQAAPFTGCFSPDNSLGVFSNQNTSGAWRLKVVDTAGQDTGTLNAWTLGLCVVSSVCGDGIVQLGEECEPSNTATCDAQCQRVPLCGDGFIDGEECDDSNSNDNDGCSSVCLIESCGDGITQTTEDCDDANNLNNDGCDNDCIHRAELTETEPNDDGSISLGGLGIDGNDFSSANANGPFSTDVTILASLNPIGDEDVFAISNPTASALNVRLDLFSAVNGLGAPCDGSTDTGLNIRDAAGALLAQNDDRSAQDRCSGLDIVLAPGDTIFAHITEFKDDAVIAGYFLVVDFQ